MAAKKSYVLRFMLTCGRPVLVVEVEAGALGLSLEFRSRISQE